jgi:hypothetical protein
VCVCVREREREMVNVKSLLLICWGASPDKGWPTTPHKSTKGATLSPIRGSLYHKGWPTTPDLVRSEFPPPPNRHHPSSSSYSYFLFSFLIFFIDDRFVI